LTDENRRAAIAAELAEADRLLEIAKRCATHDDRETAANRLWYAAMHAAKALCFSDGIEPKSHRALRRLVSARFVVPGHIDASVETALGQLETERDLADYQTGYRVTPERYAERERAAADTLAEIRRYLQDRQLL
jgi:uncharacterized protein (UPF0332 family)